MYVKAKSLDDLLSAACSLSQKLEPFTHPSNVVNILASNEILSIFQIHSLTKRSTGYFMPTKTMLKNKIKIKKRRFQEGEKNSIIAL